MAGTVDKTFILASFNAVDEFGANGIQISWTEQPYGDDIVVNLTGSYTPGLEAVGSAYPNMASAMATAMTAASVNGYVFNVDYNRYSNEYTVSEDLSQTYDIGNTPVLGISAGTGLDAYTSDYDPHYIIQVANLCMAHRGGIYEPGQISESAGTWQHYGISKSYVRQYDDFSATMETQAAVYRAHSTAGTPWTYQAFYETARNINPFFVYNVNSTSTVLSSTIHYLRDESTSFHPAQAFQDWNDRWNLDFKTVREEGSLE